MGRSIALGKNLVERLGLGHGELFVGALLLLLLLVGLGQLLELGELDVARHLAPVHLGEGDGLVLWQNRLNYPGSSA